MDVITCKALYTLNEDWLLWQVPEFSTVVCWWGRLPPPPPPDPGTEPGWELGVRGDGGFNGGHLKQNDIVPTAGGLKR